MKNNVEITEMLKSEVKKYQCEQRYLHTLSVYGECNKLADIFQISAEVSTLPAPAMERVTITPVADRNITGFAQHCFTT